MPAVHYLLLQCGLTWVLAASSIASPLRVMALAVLPPQLARGFYCFGCVGFWVGVLLYARGFYPWPSRMYGLDAGFVGTASSLLLLIVVSTERVLQAELEAVELVKQKRAVAAGKRQKATSDTIDA